jgi:hypothetical protein
LKGEIMKSNLKKFERISSLLLPFLALSAWPGSARAVVQESRYMELVEAARNSENAGPRPLGVSLAPQIAEIESLSLDPSCSPHDNWCGGTMVLGGQTVTLPRNLLIDLPANRLTLRQIFQHAPPACVAAKQSGLARTDTCRIATKGAYATLNANHNGCGKEIAGDVFIVNGPEAVTAPVTFINYTDGYFRMGGTAGSDAGGTLVRINDPIGRNTIQQGLGCLHGSSNCSPDIRFTNDSDNYTVSFKTGYPMCIPSRIVKAGHPTAANAAGLGDPLCPDTNRTAAIAPNFFVQDSRRFAPMKLGDTVTAMGGFVTVGGVTFLTAHTVTDLLGLSTRETADQPDYMVLERSQWGVAPFPESHVRAVFSGFTTLPNSQLDIFALRVDARDNESHPDPLTSTVGNPRTTNKLVAGPGGKFQIQLDIHLLAGAPVPPSISPCTHLANAGFNTCPNGGTLAEEFSVLSPPSREIQAVTRRSVPLRPGIFTLDMLSRHAPNNQFTIPLGASIGGLILAEPGEADLGKASGPLILEAFPWTLDRRTSPGGCLSSGCEASAQLLAPYPNSNVDLRNASIANGVPASAANRVLTAFDFSNGELVPRLLNLPPADGCPARN